ncbi:MAG: DNA-binding protein [Deinococcota bacterium]
MYKLEITLTDAVAQKLKQRAAQANLSPEEYAAVSVQQSLEQKPLSFDQAAEYILEKNAELYKRLA